MKSIKFSGFTFLSVTVMFMSLSCSQNVQRFDYVSKFYKIELTDTAPFVKYLSVDASGNSKLEHNPILWKKSVDSGKFELHKISDSKAEIYIKGNTGKALWVFNFDEKKFSITSNYIQDNPSKGIDFRFSKLENHTTLLGVMVSKQKTRLPAVLHLPDMGTFQVVADKPGVIVDYDASRQEGENYISVVLPVATARQIAVRYTFTTTSIYPRFPGVEKKEFAGFRRNYLNLFQVNPKLQVIANNSCSDPCAFTLFLSSMLALKTPPLVDSLTALDLLRMSVERYLNGMKAYGMYGYNGTWEGKDIVG